MSGLGPSKVEQEIDALKRQLGASTDSQLAAVLGLQRSAIAQWKKRGAVPDKARRAIEWTVAHRGANDEARAEFSRLPATLRQISRAISLLYVIRSTEEGDNEPAVLLDRALFLDELERAAYILLSETMKREGLDAPEAYRRICTATTFETDLTAKLMPARLSARI
jgi:hypothetical protein